MSLFIMINSNFYSLNCNNFYLFRHVVNAFLLVYQIGTCCVYVVFVSENIQTVLKHQFDIDLPIIQVMACILLPLILINWVRDLKYLAPFSAVANAVTIVSFGIILYFIFRKVPTIADKAPVGELANFPLFFGTVLFALEAIGVVSIGIYRLCSRITPCSYFSDYNFYSVFYICRFYHWRMK